MLGTMLLAVTMWVFGDSIGIASVTAAMIGLGILLVTVRAYYYPCRF
jgi:hypothetical protein